MSKSSQTYGIHWFRRDLRVAGNRALRWSYSQHQGRVVGVFFFDSKFLARPDFSANRFAFFLDTLVSLREELRELGSDLLVLDGGPDQGFRELFREISAAGAAQPATISWNRDYEPFARDRDGRMKKFFQDSGIATREERDHLLIEPTELGRPDGGHYQVYSPFARRWFEQVLGPEIQSRLAEQDEGLSYLKKRLAGKEIPKVFQLEWSELLGKKAKELDACAQFQSENKKKVTVPIPAAGSLAALKALEEFSPRLGEYKEDRDYPWKSGTSKLSIYFKNGSLTGSQVLAHLKLRQELFTNKTSATTFVKELAWREFYYHILWHEPRVEGESFNPKYKKLAWKNEPKLWEAWVEGRTGYPIVDAGMRQLKQTGWMHNRVRMIVASFLTKDLLIDWRWGERYFMEQLLDGDLAPNNGGWQWAASTGCDPQPYFRIFNPTLQGEKFDADGKYVRTYVEELAHLKGDDAHDLETTATVRGYVKPIVDHKVRKALALKLFSGRSA